MVLTRGWEDGGKVLVFSGYGVPIWEDENILEMDGADGFTVV